jgi:hypothetical protein
MNVDQPNNQTRIAGYLDMLLVDHSIWDEKLSLAINPPVRPQNTVAPGHYLLTTENIGSGHRVIKFTHLLNSISILNQLPFSRLRSEVLHRCLPLAAEAMLCD